MKLEESILKIISEAIMKKASEQELTEEQVKQLVETYITAITDRLANFPTSLTDTLMQKMPEMLNEHRNIQIEFEQRLQKRWEKALDLYDTCVVIGEECGELCAKEHRDQAAKDRDLVFEILMHIHVKACQTVSAVGVLLKSGYARDALARQRTLHELSVTASFIKKHGQGTAEQYWLHNAIESYKAVSQYELYCERLGCDPHEPAELDQLRSQRDRLIHLFGKVFGEQYGWAAKALGKARGVKFADIEENVNLDHLRPYYRMASHGVHANSKGLIFDIGNIYRERPGYQKMLLAGASNTGLADPGQLALISFTQCTVAFLTLKPDLETQIKTQVLNSFVHEACQAFIEIHCDLNREEEELIMVPVSWTGE
ncbi:MAG: DUF5677 domain-containing protein [Ktedonobacteraceae bacterium]